MSRSYAGYFGTPHPFVPKKLELLKNPAPRILSPATPPGGFAVQGFFVPGEIQMPFRAITAFAMLFVCVGSSLKAEVFTYNYQGLPTTNPFTGDPVQLSGTLRFEAESNANLNYVIGGEVWDRGLRVPYSPYAPYLTDGNIFEFSLTDGQTTYEFNRLNPDWAVPTVDGEFYRSNLGFHLRTDANGDITTWSLKSSCCISTNGDGYYGLYSDSRFGDDRVTEVFSTPTSRLNDDGVKFFSPESRSVAQEHSIGSYNPRTQETTAPEHIIVLTHGWQPGRNLATTPSYMQALEDDILNRLSSSGIDTTKVEFVTEKWHEAFTPAVDLSSESGRQLANRQYLTSYDAAPTVAKRIASKVSRLVQTAEADGIDPTVHLVGHSLGTVVNANVADELSRTPGGDYSIDRFTILDSPKNASRQLSETLLGVVNSNDADFYKRAAIAADDSLLFYTLLQKDFVRYVDNFYGGLGRADSIVGSKLYGLSRSPRFGQPIASAGPCTQGTCSGQFLGSDVDHQEVLEIYTNSISRSGGILAEDGSRFHWVTPAIAESHGQDTRWDPLRQLAEWTIAAENGDINISGIQIQTELQGPYPPSASTGNSSIVDNWHLEQGTVIFKDAEADLVSNSPSSFSVFVDQDELLGLTFTLDALNAGPGVFQILRNSDVFAEIDLTSPDSRISREVEIPLSLYYGDAEYTWLYDSDEIGTWVTVSEVTAHIVRPVPEPGALVITLAALALVIPYRQPHK